MMRWMLVIVVGFPIAFLGAEEKPKYRCLAPFVWELQNERQPANLFEAFLSGPYKRIGEENATAEELINEGWYSMFDGDVATARRYFREAWEREESAEALVCLAIASDDPDYRKIFSGETLKLLPPNDPNALLAAIVNSNTDFDAMEGRKKISHWLLENRNKRQIGVWLMGSYRPSGYPQGDGDFLPGLEFLESDPEWHLPRIEWVASTLNEDLIRKYLRNLNPEDLREGALMRAIEYAMSNGSLADTMRFVEEQLHSRRAGNELWWNESALVDLAWCANQEEVARAWLALWRKNSRLRMGPDWEAEMIREWEKRLNEMNQVPNSEKASYILEASDSSGSSHLSSLVRQIETKAKSGDLRSALFAVDSDLAAAINGADLKDELLAILKPILKKGGRSVDDWIDEEKLVVPLPRPVQPPKLESTFLDQLGGDPLDVAAPENRANLLLFYSGIGCPACQIELQAFQAEHDAFRKIGVDIVAISPQPIAQLHRALNQTGQKFPFTFCSDTELRVFQATGVYDEFEEYPLHGAVVIGGDGEILFTAYGYAPLRDAETVLERARVVLGQDKTVE